MGKRRIALFQKRPHRTDDFPAARPGRLLHQYSLLCAPGVLRRGTYSENAGGDRGLLPLRRIHVHQRHNGLQAGKPAESRSAGACRRAFAAPLRELARTRQGHGRILVRPDAADGPDDPQVQPRQAVPGIHHGNRLARGDHGERVHRGDAGGLRRAAALFGPHAAVRERAALVRLSGRPRPPRRSRSEFRADPRRCDSQTGLLRIRRPVGTGPRRGIRQADRDRRPESVDSALPAERRRRVCDVELPPGPEYADRAAE